MPEHIKLRTTLTLHRQIGACRSTKIAFEERLQAVTDSHMLFSYGEVMGEIGDNPTCVVTMAHHPQDRLEDAIREFTKTLCELDRHDLSWPEVSIDDTGNERPISAILAGDGVSIDDIRVVKHGPVDSPTALLPELIGDGGASKLSASIENPVSMSPTGRRLTDPHPKPAPVRQTAIAA